ncbi:MAG: IS110 family transposase, partial [Flavobacteriaceae bacterium]
MKKISFKDKDIFVGIDVHKKSWDIKILTAHTFQKQIHKTLPSPEFVANYLNAHYPQANFKCVYEAGFCGFWIQERLSKLGLNTIIVHPGDVPTTDKEKRFKDDRIDSKKLALSLRSGQLMGIHIPSKQMQRDRSLVRQRYQYASDERRMKNRITSHLDFYGIKIEEVDKNRYWSNSYVTKLERFASEHGDVVLDNYLNKLRKERDMSLYMTRELRELSKTDRYRQSFDLLRSIPGVGLLTAMVFLTEIGDITRFKKDDHFIAYIGFIPGSHSSGEREYRTRISKRGNKRVRTALILSAWMSIRNNAEMACYYENYRSSGKPANKAIVKIARKLALRMKAVLR